MRTGSTGRRRSTASTSRWSATSPATRADDILWYAPGEAVDVLWIAARRARAARTRSPGCGSRSTATTDRSSATSSATTTTTSSGTGPAPRPTRSGRRSPSDAVFERVDRLTVDGDYRPEVLRDYRDGAHKDRVVWQRTSKGHDVVWAFDGDGLGGYRSERVEIRTDVAVRAGDWDGDDLDDLLLYGPGTVEDGLWLSGSDDGFTEHDLEINGEYQPVTVIGAERDGVFLFGSGAAADRYLRSEGSSFTSAAGRLVPDRRAWPTAPTPGASRSCTAPRRAPARTGSSSRTAAAGASS